MIKFGPILRKLVHFTYDGFAITLCVFKRGDCFVDLAFFVYFSAYYELQLGYMENLADNITHRIIYLPPKYYFTQTFFNLLRGHPTLDKAVSI